MSHLVSRSVVYVLFCVVFLSGFASGNQRAWAQSAPSATPAPAPEQQSAPETPPIPGRFIVLLNEKLVSGKGKENQPVHLIVANDVLGPDGKTVIIPKGAAAEGILLESSGPKNFGRPGKIRLTCDTILLEGGQRIPVRIIRGGQRLGKDNRPLLNWVSVPFELIGGFGFISSVLASPDNNGFIDSRALGAVVGLALVGFGELMRGVFGPFVSGERVTLEAGTPFAVELIGEVPRTAPAPLPTPTPPSSQ